MDRAQCEWLWREAQSIPQGAKFPPGGGFKLPPEVFPALVEQAQAKDIKVLTARSQTDLAMTMLGLGGSLKEVSVIAGDPRGVPLAMKPARVIIIPTFGEGEDLNQRTYFLTHELAHAVAWERTTSGYKSVNDMEYIIEELTAELSAMEILAREFPDAKDGVTYTALGYALGWCVRYFSKAELCHPELFKSILCGVLPQMISERVADLSPYFACATHFSAV